jgi:FKBP-type peptidyl-prolyl cis-trans isomerase (trigger factor)
MSPTDIVDAILTVTQVEVPDMVLDEEVNRMLSRLVQQLQPLNLGMEAYLKSINKTGDQIRAEYAQVAQKNVASEMALVEIVAREKVEVDDKEVEATADAMGDAKLKERYTKNPLEKAYIKAIIAKNKLIWKLISEVEGEDLKDEEKKEENDKVAIQDAK